MQHFYRRAPFLTQELLSCKPSIYQKKLIFYRLNYKNNLLILHGFYLSKRARELENLFWSLFRNIIFEEK
ncbi:MAG: hypothetical protein RIT27_1510 [Pseudomonadota bacterium]|jgi:hypothetical protein